MMQRVTCVIAAALLLAAVASAAQWVKVESGVDVSLYDVTDSAAGFFAVGGGGVVLNRTENGWIKILDGGPTGNGNDLYTCDVTDDEERLWFAGSSGAIGEMDVVTGAVTDHSAPLDSGDNIKAIAATGRENEANVYTATASGLFFYNFDDGAEGKWNYVTPGSGSNINGLSMYGEKKGHIVDGNSDAFITQDGTTFNKMGIPNADSTPQDVYSNGKFSVWASAGGGMVYRYDSTANWNFTKVSPNADATLQAISLNSGETNGYTVGSGGAVFRLLDNYGAGTWEEETTPVGQNLKGVAFDDSTAIAVGAAGTIVEKE